jgi:hypothetical protein
MGGSELTWNLFFLEDVVTRKIKLFYEQMVITLHPLPCR